MSNGIKTLADAQPGGRVQVMPSDAARALLAAQYRDDGDKAKAIRINHKSLTDSDKRALRAIEAALSAQPSPGGQDALADAARRVISDIDSGDYHGEISEATYAALEEALAARQPVGQEPMAFDYPEFNPVEMGCVLEDRGIHFLSDAMRCGFDEALNQMKAIIESIGPLYAAPPAQAVDLGPVRDALKAAEGLATICASVDGYSREEVAASGRAMRKQFADALAEVDSQAVGNG